MDRLASAALCDGWEVRVLHALQVSTVSLILLEFVLTVFAFSIYHYDWPVRHAGLAEIAAIGERTGKVGLRVLYDCL